MRLCFLAHPSIFAAFPQHTKNLQVVGLVVSSVGLIATGFVSNANQLIGTVGIMYPFAAGKSAF